MPYKSKARCNQRAKERRIEQTRLYGIARCSVNAYNSRLKRRNAVLAAYGNKCACCNEPENEFLVIDHINNDGAKHRRKVGKGGPMFYIWLQKHNYPKGFQVLCCNCNWSKQRGFGVCIHQRNK